MQIPLASIGLALGSLFAVMLLAWGTVESAIVDTGYSRLGLIAQTRGDELKNRLIHAKEDLAFLSRDSRVTTNAGDLIASFDADPLEHQAIVADFIQGVTEDERLARAETATPTTYGRRHVRLHEAVRVVVEREHYDDILILDPAGRIVYSATKGQDFAHSVDEAMFAETSLAPMFRRLQGAGDREILFEDFRPYIAGEEPAGFLGIPLIRRSNVAMNTAQPDVRIGYLLVKLSSELVDSVVLRREGLGATGEIVVLHRDGRLLNNPPRMRGLYAGSSISNITLIEDLPAAGGRAEIRIGKGGVPHLAVAASIAFEGASWSLLVLQTKAEALSSLDALARNLALGGGFVGLIAVALAFRMTTAVIQPLAELTQALQRLARREWMEEIPGSGRRDEIGAIARAVVSIRDVTAEKANADAERYRLVSEENRRLANIDILTRLENRRGFFDGIAARSAGLGNDRCCTAILMDLDGFKQINDAFGHAAGDRLLVEVGARLRRVFGPDALLARLGGDEFAAFLWANEDEAAERRAKEAIAAVAADISVNRFDTANVGISIGIHCFAWGEVSVDEAIQHADVALYAAKSAGKSTYRFYSHTLEGERQRRNRLEVELKRSLATAPACHCTTSPSSMRRRIR